MGLLALLICLCGIVFVMRLLAKRRSSAATLSAATAMSPAGVERRSGAQHNRIVERKAYDNGAAKYTFEHERPDKNWSPLTNRQQALVGEIYHHAAIAEFMKGQDQAIEVRREPLNPHDRNALAVIGCWRAATGKPHEGLLGYLPREFAASMAALRPADMPLKAFPRSVYIGETVLDVKIDLYEPSPESGYWQPKRLIPPIKLENV